MAGHVGPVSSPAMTYSASLREEPGGGYVVQYSGRARQLPAITGALVTSHRCEELEDIHQSDSSQTGSQRSVLCNVFYTPLGCNIQPKRPSQIHKKILCEKLLSTRHEANVSVFVGAGY